MYIYIYITHTLYTWGAMQINSTYFSRFRAPPYTRREPEWKERCYSSQVIMLMVKENGCDYVPFRIQPEKQLQNYWGDNTIPRTCPKNPRDLHCGTWPEACLESPLASRRLDSAPGRKFGSSRLVSGFMLSRL